MAVRNRNHSLIVLTVGLFLLASCVPEDSKPPPKAVKGVLNLSHYSFQKQGPARLDGQWKFAWDTLLTPDSENGFNDHFEVPGNWPGTTANGQQIPSEGFATYKLLVHLPHAGSDLSFYLPIIGHASRIWINGIEQYSSGTVGTTPQAMEPEIAVDTFTFFPTAKTLEIVMQVSNFVHRSGGLDNSILLGEDQQISRLRLKNVAVEMLLVGSLCFMALFHFVIAFLFHKKRSSILFGFLCSTIAARNLLTGEQLISYLIPSLPWQWEYKLEYLTAFSFAIPLISSFVYDLFPIARTKTIFIGIIGINVLNGFFILSSPVSTFSCFLWGFDTTLLLGAAYIAYLLIHANHNKLKGSAVLITGGSILLLTVINDMIYYQFHLSIGPLTSYGFLIFLLSQAAAFSLQFIYEYKSIQQFSFTLESQVRERTENLEQANQLLKEEIKRKEEIEEKLRKLSTTDPLTKIDNRYRFNETLDEEIKRVRRYDSELSIIMFDIDFFKKINDTYGHDAGDKVLVAIARLVESTIRDIDRFARWGGEEFIILAPNIDIDGAEILAERIRERVENMAVRPVEKVTISFGVTQFEHAESRNNLLKRVDDALYDAKRAGRNRVIKRHYAGTEEPFSSME